MSKQWFLIKSLGSTIDLSLVTQIVWNYKSGNKTYTQIYLGTSVAYDPDTSEITSNQWYINDFADRHRLQSSLVALGVPTIDLVFDANEKAT